MSLNILNKLMPGLPLYFIGWSLLNRIDITHLELWSVEEESKKKEIQADLVDDSTTRVNII